MTPKLFQLQYLRFSINSYVCRKRNITSTYNTSRHDYSKQMFFSTHHWIISNHKNNTNQSNSSHHSWASTASTMAKAKQPKKLKKGRDPPSGTTISTTTIQQQSTASGMGSTTEKTTVDTSAVVTEMTTIPLFPRERQQPPSPTPLPGHQKAPPSPIRQLLNKLPLLRR